MCKRVSLIATVIATALLYSSTASLPIDAQQQGQNTAIESLNFLLGKWVGEGTAETGQAGSGSCSFERGLQDKVLLRKNHAEYPPADGRPAIVHDDVMIIYSDHVKQQLRAFYTDNEGNVINYTIGSAADGKSAVFISDANAGTRRYRLTYTVTRPGHMTITFEMAPPSKPDQFQKFIDGKLRRPDEAS